MKYAIFGAFCLVAIPLMVWAACSLTQFRGLLLSALILSTCLGPGSSIHLITYEGYRGTEDGVIVYLTDVICMSLIVALVLKFGSQLRWVPYNAWSLLCLFLLACVSSLQAPNPTFACLALFTFVKAYAIYWCVYNCLSLGTPPIFVWYGLVSVGGLLSLITAKQHFITHALRVSGLFPHPNTLPSYSFLFLPLLVLWALCGPGLSNLQRPLTLCIACGLSFGIVETLSRAGIVLLGLLLLVSIALALVRAPSPYVRKLCGVLLVVMAAGGLILSAQILHRFINAPQASGEARDEFNIAALRMADDYPVGVGPNNYSYALSNIARYRRSLVVLQYETEAGVCHNIYLLTAAEFGWGGLVLLSIVLFRFLWRAAAAAARTRKFEGVALHAICIGWFCVLANGSLEWVLRQPFVMNMFAITAAMSVGIADAVYARRRPPVDRVFLRPGLRPLRSGPDSMSQRCSSG